MDFSDKRVERNENGVPIDTEEARAEMFLGELWYRVTDSEGNFDKEKAIKTLLKMREVNSFEFFEKRS